jgi:hypothetical protein
MMARLQRLINSLSCENTLMVTIMSPKPLGVDDLMIATTRLV